LDHEAKLDLALWDLSHLKISRRGQQKDRKAGSNKYRRSAAVLTE